jgi:hypothetical protein
MDQRAWSHLIMTAVTVAGVAVIMWMEAPDWQREAIRRKIRLRLRRAAALVAARSGHRAMGDELSGHQAEAEAGYGLTYRLSMFRDRL